MISEGGSRLAIFTVIINDQVPCNDRVLLLLVLFSPTSENTLSASAFAWDNTRTSLATAASISNSQIWLLSPVHQEHNGKTYFDFFID